MKTRLLCGLAAIAAAFALPAQAHGWFHHHSDQTTSYNSEQAPLDGDSIHTAANNPDDQAIADQVANALRNDRGLNGTTVTVAVNDGRVSLAGSASNRADAYRVENIAKAAAGPGRVVAGSIDANG